MKTLSVGELGHSGPKGSQRKIERGGLDLHSEFPRYQLEMRKACVDLCLESTEPFELSPALPRRISKPRSFSLKSPSSLKSSLSRAPPIAKGNRGLRWVLV
jgi:hypothetical protein